MSVPPPLSDDSVVRLDPAVEFLDVEVDECALLCQTDRCAGMVVPPGEGLVDFVRSLSVQPLRVGDLRQQYEDAGLVDEILSSLLAHGFAQSVPPETSLLRAVRRTLSIDLDAGISNEALFTRWIAGNTPDVLLQCLRLDDHSRIFAELARCRSTATLCAHHVIVRTSDARSNQDLLASLLRLGAAVEIDGLRWPVPGTPVPGLRELVSARIPTHILMSPDSSILNESVRRHCVEWLQNECVSGLCLRLDPSAIRQEEFSTLFTAVQELETAIGDVVAINLPADEVLLGNTAYQPLSEAESEPARQLRLAWLRWRIPLLKGFESDCPWSQIPEVEDSWVRSAEDFLPNHPELLRVKPGSSIVDVCGGLGRVARRLSPVVGPNGLIISIELRRFLTERARVFSCQANFTNLQFRPGRAERLPLANSSVDAAVNEWTGAIWELGFGPAMIKEMARVVRPGGRIAITHRLVQLQLDRLDQPWVQYQDIYQRVRDAFRHPELSVVTERIWGQTIPSRAGQNELYWMEQYMPRLVNPHDRVLPNGDPESICTSADVYLTVIAEKRRS
jgi:SAM-dependent methyltransferase